MAAVRLRLSLRLRRVHRSQVDRRVYTLRVYTRVCVRLRENPREPRLYTRPSIYLSILLLPGHRSVRGGTRLRVLTLDRASVRARGIGHT